MNLLEPNKTGDFWPLNDDAVSGEQFIAGKTLAEWQADVAPENASQYANAWITVEDWALLASQSEGTQLVSDQGDVLGWIGNPSADAESVTTSVHSRLLLHPWDLLFMNEHIIASLENSEYIGDVSPAAHIEGVLTVGEGTRILPGVFIGGNAIIGKNCKIGPNCYIRGNTAIGDGVHIGQAVEVKNSIIGHGSSVGHLSYVGDSVIGTKVNFGAATVTSNLRHDGTNHRSAVSGELVDTGRRKFGTIVGDNVHTGIHTAIYPGRKLGPNTSTRPNDSVQKDLK